MIVFSVSTDLFGQLFAGLSLVAVIDFLYTGRGGVLTIIGSVVIFGAFIVLFWWMEGRDSTLRQRVQAMPKGQRSRWQIGARP